MKNSQSRLLGREERVSQNGRASRDLPLILLVGILLVAGCSSIGRLAKSRSDSGSGEDQPSNTARTTEPLAERQLPLDQPRVMDYASLQFTVTKAVISGRVNHELPIDNSKPEVADITFSVVNTLKDGVRVGSALWQLTLGDGSVYKLPYTDSFQPRDTRDVKISFRVPKNSQWTGANLKLDEQDKEPATLTLEGPAPPPQFPMHLATGSEATTKAPDVTYSIVKAVEDLDANGKRALLGKRYLNLTVHITDKGGSSGGYYLPENFRLLIDGNPSKPESAGDNDVMKPLTSQDYTMSYVIPANAGSMELEVGKPVGLSDTETAKIPINVAPPSAQ